MSYCIDNEYNEYSEEETNTFNICDKIVVVMNNNTFLIQITFRELLRYSDSWSFNRRIDDNKTEELYQTLCQGYDIPWTLHAVYDNTVSSYYKKILILDGQHRKKAINTYIENNDAYMTCNRKVWIWIYKIDYSETTNSSMAHDFFKKINNNRVFQNEELPNTFVINLVNMISKNKVLRKGIKCQDANQTSHSPFIHKKELNAILNENKEIIKTMTLEEIIDNIIKINNKLSLKVYENIYGRDKSHQNKFNKAISIGFFLNLGKKSKYPLTTWIKFIGNPNDFS